MTISLRWPDLTACLFYCQPCEIFSCRLNVRMDDRQKKHQTFFDDFTFSEWFLLLFMFPCQKQALQLIKNSQLVFHGLSTRALSPMSANKMHEHGRHGLGEVMDEDPISSPCHPAHPAILPASYTSHSCWHSLWRLPKYPGCVVYTVLIFGLTRTFLARWQSCCRDPNSCWVRFLPTCQLTRQRLRSAAQINSARDPLMFCSPTL